MNTNIQQNGITIIIDGISEHRMITSYEDVSLCLQNTSKKFIQTVWNFISGYIIMFKCPMVADAKIIMTLTYEKLEVDSRHSIHTMEVYTQINKQDTSLFYLIECDNRCKKIKVCRSGNHPEEWAIYPLHTLCMRQLSRWYMLFFNTNIYSRLGYLYDGSYVDIFLATLQQQNKQYTLDTEMFVIYNDVTKDYNYYSH